MQPRISGVEDTQEISLRLERYDDIFSDFDIRPYSRRALSVDFLDEIRRATADKNDSGIELLLFAPEKEHNESHEATIRERLAEHFKKHYGLILAERRKIIKRGFLMVLLGVIFMIAATLIIFKDPSKDILMSFLVVFLEPAAWFLLWEGMAQILFTEKEISSELNFYRKMSATPHLIHFKSY